MGDMATTQDQLDAAMRRMESRRTIVDCGYSTPCWVTNYSQNRRGYARIKIRPETNSRALHRFVYEYLVGPISDGLTIDHLCRNPPCCNPAHHEPVTAVENVMRGSGFAPTRKAQKLCKRGHALAGRNLRITNKGTRECRACNTIRARERRSRLRSQAAA